MTSKEALNNIRDYNTELIHDVGCEYIENPLEEECNIIEKDLEELEYQKRKNADLLETINCIKNHAMVKKAKGLGTEVIVSFHSSDDDFEKIGWFFDIMKF